MPTPGVNVTFTDVSPASGAPTDTGQWFVAGVTERGPVGTAHKIESLSAYEATFGTRESYTPIYDALETFFRVGGTTAFLSRVVGPAAVQASHVFTGPASAAAITVKAANKGEYGNDLLVAIITGTAYKIQVSDASGILETSPDLADNDAAVTWGANDSSYVVVVKDGATAPSTVTATPLTGGDDDRDGITDTEKIAAFTAFTKTLGPGQVSYPGDADAEVAAGIINHCLLNNRVAVLDPTAGTFAEMVASATALRGDAGTDLAAMFGPVVKIPGLLTGTTRTVPYSAVEAGLIARSDRVYGPGRAVAGSELPLRYVVDFTDYTDAEHETALLAGLNLSKNVYGSLQTYGFRSLANPAVSTNWLQFNYARLRMAITASLESIAEGFVFAPLDGKGHTLIQFKDALSGVLAQFYAQDALYGANASEAFSVDTGSSVNTPETLALGQLRAQVAVRFSPHAETVYIDIAKTPITQSL